MIATWRKSQLLAAQTVTPHWATGNAAALSVELTIFRAESRDTNHYATESASRCYLISNSDLRVVAMLFAESISENR